MTVIGLSGVSIFFVLSDSGLGGAALFARQVQFDGRAATGTGVHVERGVDALCALTHDMDADMAVALFQRGGSIEADAIIADRQGEVLVIGEAHLDVAGLGVLADVRQRFLHDE